MQIHILKKGLILGVIILFFGTGVLPSVDGKSVAPTVDDNTINNPTMRITFVIIGLLTDKLNSGKNVFNYVIIIGYEWTFKDGKYLKYPDSGPIIDSPFGFAYGYKIGILTDHFVCAIFFNIS